MLMLIGAVSGRVVARWHAGMQGPLTTTLADNFLIYHYWNPEALTYQMGVVELFTSSTAPSDPISLLLGGAPDWPARGQPDSYGAPAPRPLRRRTLLGGGGHARRDTDDHRAHAQARPRRHLRWPTCSSTNATSTRAGRSCREARNDERRRPRGGQCRTARRSAASRR